MLLLQDPSFPEKLYLRGEQSLSDVELLTVVLGPGNEDKVRNLLTYFGNSLLAVRSASIPKLANFVTEKQAIKIRAFFELGRRLTLEPLADRPQVRCSKDSYNIMASNLAHLEHEECWMLCLNRANHVTNYIQISSGGRAGTVVDAKIVFGKALEYGASSIIIAHNHPSTNLQPSQADIQLTHKLYSAGKTMDLPLLDHLIISAKGYYSFADEGNMD